MKKKVAIQGLKGSFHHEAAQHYFGAQVVPVECETFPEVVGMVLKSEVDFALMAIENSLAGSIIPNYSLLRQKELSICGEIILRVRMNLMVYNNTTLNDVKEIHSHQMAIRQCSTFLQIHPSVKIVESFDTAGSAQFIRENKLKHVAAIASAEAAKTYGLSIIEKGIENEESFTRFLVLSKEDISADFNKASLYIETAHEPGSLASVLNVISEHGINLSKLQSHPVSGRKRTYGFFIDLEFDSIDQWHKTKAALQGITEVLDVLGIYKKGKTYE